MSETITILTGLLSGMAGAIGGVFLIRTFVGKGIEHFFAIALQERDRVGTSALEFRKQQLAEFYGPIYAYCKLSQQLYEVWLAGKLQDINTEIIATFREQNERIFNILSTKLHLVDGDTLPPVFIRFTTAETIWNLYTARRDQPWVPAEVATLPQATYPKEFDEYIFETTEKLKHTINDLHRKYGIT